MNAMTNQNATNADLQNNPNAGACRARVRYFDPPSHSCVHGPQALRWAGFLGLYPQCLPPPRLLQAVLRVGMVLHHRRPHPFPILGLVRFELMQTSLLVARSHEVGALEQPLLRPLATLVPQRTHSLPCLVVGSLLLMRGLRRKVTLLQP